MIPILDSSLKIIVLIGSTALRKVLSKEEAENIIDMLPDIDIIRTDDKLIENEYKKLL